MEQGEVGEAEASPEGVTDLSKMEVDRYIGVGVRVGRREDLASGWS